MTAAWAGGEEVPNYVTRVQRVDAGLIEAQPIVEEPTVTAEQSPKPKADTTTKGSLETKLDRAVEIDIYIKQHYPNAAAQVRERVAVELALAGDNEWMKYVRVANGESGWNPGALGSAKEVGLWQLHPCHKSKFNWSLLARTDDLGIFYQVRCARQQRKDAGWSCWTVARNLGIR